MDLSSKQNTGFSLTELMVTLAVTGIILPVVFTTYLNIKNHYTAQQALLQNQAEARLAIHLLRRAIYQAGYSACFALNASGEINHHAITAFDFTRATALQGYHATASGWQPSLPASLVGKVKTGTDVIKLMGVDFNLAVLKNDMLITDSLTVSPELSVKKGDILVVTDCIQADLFTVASVSNSANQQTIRSNEALSVRYRQNAGIGRLQIQSFYIRDTNRKNRAGDPIYALYSQGDNGISEELVTDIEDMRIRYGINSNRDGHVNEYLPADRINDWGAVRMVDMLLLVSANDSSSRSRSAYQFDGETHIAPDGRLRKEWSVTIKLQQRS